MESFQRICICLFAITIFVRVKAMDEEEGREMIRGMAASCKEKVGATDAHVDNMLNKEDPTEQPDKCLRGCLMEQFGIIEDNKFKPEAMVEITKMATDNDEEKVKLSEEICGECSDIADPDSCELAVKIIECLKAGAVKRGLDPKTM